MSFPQCTDSDTRSKRRLRKGAQIAILTLIFCSGYIAIRALPVEQCDIMHYRDYISAEGAIELCGEGEAIFFDLKRIRYPVHVAISPVTPVRTGEQATFRLSLANSRGEPITYDELAVNHTERIHVMAIDEGLQDYHHVHPKPTSAPGVFEFSFAPEFSGVYAIYLDFIPVRAGRRTLARSEVRVDGNKPSLILERGTETTVEKGEIRYSLHFDSAEVVEGEDQKVTLRAKHREGEDIKFSLTMGAFAHLVVFDGDGRGFAHLHPMNPFVDQQDPNDPDLDFAFRPDQPGFFRIWAQMNINGSEVFIPFNLLVSDKRSIASRSS